MAVGRCHACGQDTHIELILDGPNQGRWLCLGCREADLPNPGFAAILDAYVETANEYAMAVYRLERRLGGTRYGVAQAQARYYARAAAYEAARKEDK